MVTWFFNTWVFFSSFIHLLIYCVWSSKVSVEVRGQLWGLGSLLSICGFWGSNSDHQVWEQDYVLSYCPCPFTTIATTAAITTTATTAIFQSMGLREGSVFQRTRVWLLIPWWLTTVSNSSSRETDALFWTCRAPGMRMVHRHTCRWNSHTHKIK